MNKYYLEKADINNPKLYETEIVSDTVVDILPDDKITHGKILDAECVLMDSATVWKVGEETMRRDPYFFVNVHKL